MTEGSCVAHSTSMPSRLAAAASRRATPIAARWSRLAVGSSASSTAGRVTSARASATRWRSPPESSPARRPASSLRPTAASAAATASGSRRPRICAARATFSRADRWPASAAACGTKASDSRRKPASWARLSAPRPRPPTTTSPALGRSSPATMCSSVVFPLPDGPTVGPSGSGKTTLLHIVAGLERPSAGEVVVGGRGLGALSRAQLAGFRRESLAFVPQAAALAGHLSARENVALAAQIRGRRDPEAVAAALAAVGLSELAGRRAGELSGGERQRVALARALVTRPAVLLADEPTANLDQRAAIGVARLLAAAASRDGMLVLCATHDPSVIAEADRVVRL